MNGRRSIPQPWRRRRGGPRAATAAAAGDESGRSPGTGRRLLGLLRPHQPMLWGIAGLGVASIVLNVTGPRLLGHATDLLAGRIASGGRHADMPGELGRVLLAALLVYLVSGLCWIAQGRLMTRLVQRIGRRLRAAAEAKLSRLPLAYLDRQPRGEVLSRVTNDIDNVVQTLQQSIIQITNSLLLVVGVVGMMMWLSPLLAVTALATVPLTTAITSVIARRAQTEFEGQWRTTGQLNAKIDEVYTAHAVVKAFGRQEETAAALRQDNEALFRFGLRAQFVSGTVGPVMTFIGNLGYVIVTTVGALQVISGGMSIGGVQAMIQYSRQFAGPLTNAASLSNVIQSGVASAARVFELLDETEMRDNLAEPARPAAGRGGVIFESVSFRYRPDTPLIDALSLTVEPGKKVAIVGSTGSGKTTLVNLLLRYYDVMDGCILLDGVDIAHMSRTDLRARVGMVPQEPWLFSGTIAENIAYGKQGATREEIEAAAATVQVDRLIRTLPHGYDTVLNESGEGVSAGEKQLITVARALLSDPVLLVLDEATSSVDTRTEVLLQQALQRVSRSRTTFVIAHRLSTIRDADLVVFMERGEIREQGTHEELMKAEGAYARMYAAQFMKSLTET